MKRTPIIKQSERKSDFSVNQQTDFFVDIATLLGMKYYPGKTKDGVDRIGLIFIFTDKMDPDNYIYSQVMFDLETEDEKRLMRSHPQNIANWSKEFIDNHFMPLIAGAKPGKNSYGTDLMFNIIPPAVQYYQFECVYSDNNSKTDIIRKVNCPKSVWLQLSQFIYWFLCGYPASSDIFFDNKYKNAKLYSATGLLFDGSCHTTFNNINVIMAHFTMYWKCGLDTGTFGFNIPCSPEDGTLIERHPIPTEEYIKLYSKDDTISPDRLFSIPSPDRLAALLSGVNGENFYRIYTLDKDMVERTHWLDWGKHIFITKNE